MARKTIKKRIPAIFLLAVLCGTTAMLLAGNLWAAQDSKKDVKTEAVAAQSGPPWGVRCDDIKEGEKATGKYCEMVQSISVSQKDADPSTAQRLLEIAIGYPPAANGKANGILILPLGILVTENVVLEIDGKKEKSFPVRYCEVAGCFSGFELGEKEMGKLAKGKAMTVKTVSAAGQPVTIELSLSGFSNAYEKIKPAKSGGLFD